MDTPPPERDLATFPAGDHIDIIHQVIHNISGEQLLQSYMRHRVPSPLRSWDPINDGQICFITDRIWQVRGMVLDQRLREVLPTLRYVQILLSHGRAIWIFDKEDDPEALSYLLCWLHSSQPFPAVPLRDLRQWQHVIRLWKIADKYSARTVKDDITGIILASRLSDRATTMFFVDVVQILKENNEKFSPQARHFIRMVVSRSTVYVRTGILDGVIPLFIPLEVNGLEEMELAGRKAYRNYFYFYWTGSLLRSTSSFDVERPEDWQYLLNIWKVAKKHNGFMLLRRLQAMMLYEMSLEHVQEPESIIAVMHVFLDHTDAQEDDVLRGGLFDKVVEENYHFLASDEFRLYTTYDQKLALPQAKNTNGTATIAIKHDTTVALKSYVMLFELLLTAIVRSLSPGSKHPNEAATAAMLKSTPNGLRFKHYLGLNRAPLHREHVDMSTRMVWRTRLDEHSARVRMGRLYRPSNLERQAMWQRKMVGTLDHQLERRKPWRW